MAARRTEMHRLQELVRLLQDLIVGDVLTSVDQDAGKLVLVYAFQPPQKVDVGVVLTLDNATPLPAPSRLNRSRLGEGGEDPSLVSPAVVVRTECHFSRA